jgi:hypothetical protein
VENAELFQHGPSIVVDLFPGQTVVGVERVHAAKREFDVLTRCRKTSPPAKVRTAYHDFNENGLVCDMSALNLDF